MGDIFRSAEYARRKQQAEKSQGLSPDEFGRIAKEIAQSSAAAAAARAAQAAANTSPNQTPAFCVFGGCEYVGVMGDGQCPSCNNFTLQEVN